MATKQTTWIIELEEDPDTGELFMQLPQELIDDLGWQIGDTLNWEPGHEGSYRLTKKT